YNTMVPSFVAKPNIVDRGEARVRLGDIYVVYLKDGGSVTVDLTDATGTLQVEWFNPVTGAYSGLTTVAGEASQTFNTPFTGDAVLSIFKVGSIDQTRPNPPAGLTVQ
ncbi:MAG: putative collagen-binding domain-containing protein, partial [Planctomycetota bacterium]